MSDLQPELSVIMPAYNEEACIADTIADVRRQILAHIPQSEFIIVNDGSTDSTRAGITAAAADESRIHLLNQTNAGHGAALRSGLEAACGEYVLLLDSDRQIDLACFPRFWHLHRQYDVLLGIRRRRYDPCLRLLLTRVIRLGIATLFGVHLYDANAPFKLFPRRLWLEERHLVPPGTLAPSLFLAVIFACKGRHVLELNVHHCPRRTGKVSLKKWRLFRFCCQGVRQLMQLKKKL